MNKYIVNITDTALSDLNALYNYIATVKLSPQNAINQYNRIANAILSLNEFPSRFALFDSEPERSIGIHRMIVDNFLVCYIVEHNIVTVTDVLYGASNVHSKLKKRY